MVYGVLVAGLQEARAYDVVRGVDFIARFVDPAGESIQYAAGQVSHLFENGLVSRVMRRICILVVNF